MRPILDVARELGVAEEHVEAWGRGKAKLALEALRAPATAAGRLVLVSAINPTAAGEGKTTVSIALAMAMRRLGMRPVLSLRQPSLGPVFGLKGGATGGGAASLEPADDVNLHFTGDLHAVTAAHNLLAAMVDNALHFGEAFDGAPLEPTQITWGRALDVDDRALRHVVVGLGGKANGPPREERFDITAASEVMAILALATSHEDLEARLARIAVGSTRAGRSVTAGDLGAAGAMTALLRDALRPNLVQTAEGGPALVHAGPFGNIAHGCSSVLATRLAIHVGDYAITEAGFGFDLGGEKFLDVACRTLGAWPRVVVLVATVRALAMHGGGTPDDVEAVERGAEHLVHHVEAVRAFGLSPVVALNLFAGDPPAALAAVERAAAAASAPIARCDGFARGGDGALELARLVDAVARATDAAPPAPRFLYDLGDPPLEKLRKIARVVYGAADVALAPAADAALLRARDLGHDMLPVCIAKTASSLSDDPQRLGRPRDFVVTVRDVRVAAGAGFLVALAGDILTMPGLPRVPAARHVRLDADGRIHGLMQKA